MDASPAGTTAYSNLETCVKGSNLRGTVAVLQREGKLGRAIAASPPALRELLQNPPPSTAWISFDAMDALQLVIENEFGLGECRRISRESVQTGIMPLLQSVLGGLMRLFGSSPHTIASRLADIMKVTTRGVEYRYTRLGDRACLVRVAYPLRTALRPGSFEAIAGGLESMFGLCGVKGTVSAARVVPDGKSNAADFEMSW